MKKLLFIVLILLFSGLGWYLFIKKYDYEFQMQLKYGPGVSYFEVSDWKNFSSTSKKTDINIVSRDPFNTITQKIEGGKTGDLELFWEFEKNNDSVTNVNLSVRSSKDQLANRWDIINPFVSSIYIDTLKQRMLGFKKRLNEVQQTYRVSLQNEITRSPDMNCICHSSTNIPVKSKAQEMLATIGFLENYVLERDIKLTGAPFVKITKWDRESDLIDFDFCFPVNLAQDIKPTPQIDFREMKSFTALKAVFNGNYRLSHLAWYDLLNKAEEQDLKTNALPLEIFYNNPKKEIESENWKTDVFLPIIK
ncbi:GyrI-like domain-containing protein [Christiangramia sediminis]|uniref:GyrI-like domain-containing protein n=1 Tax=Christiangramia sediminis TaxID=2881336 RepID=A0A9X1LGN5_9FLAO|nr:GyrI-like domain-containing protein [Christiangramia sediminis]MCB7480002.1 GyrI-like domain-containing protein [Christiangramia sediminis]